MSTGMVLLVTIAVFAVLVGLIGFYLEASEYWEHRLREARDTRDLLRRHWDS